MFGRAYAVFYNQIELGKLEIDGGVFYGKEDRAITTRLKLHWVRLLAHDEVVQFLSGLAAHVVNNAPPQNAEYAAANRAISAAMLKTLWDSYRISRFDLPGNDNVDWGELELHLHGTPTWYFGRRDCEAFAALKRAKIAV
jgi:hypothetical protein